MRQELPLEQKDYTIVIPVYCNSGSLAATHGQLREKVVERNPQWRGEILFVDDGSTDDSLEQLVAIQGKDPGLVRVIKLTRNFGQLAAILAGYGCARGKCIIAISADLQDPPELINDMLKHHFQDGFHIVIGTRAERKESAYRALTSRLFYGLMRKMITEKLPSGGYDYFLVSDTVKDMILQSNEKNSFMQAQILLLGFEPKFLPYQRKKREVGKSRWSLSKKIKYTIDSILSYSYLPLRLMSLFGIFCALAGFIYAGVVFIAKLSGDVPVKGWAPTMIMILVLSGLQMLMLGIIGEYLWRVLDQVRDRKQFIIEKIYE